jgi:hypothetical protein
MEIYFEDLNERKQKQILRKMKIEKPEDANLDLVPLAVIQMGGI